MVIYNRPSNIIALVHGAKEYYINRPETPFGPNNGGSGPPPGQIIESYETSVGVTGDINYENPSATFGDILVQIS